MPAKHLTTEKVFQKKLKKLPLHVHKKVINALSEIERNPLSGEKLHGELAGYYKYRIGDYRIIYHFNTKKSLVIILKIEHRQGVYK